MTNTLFSLRSTIKQDIGCCPAELVYGTTLRLPGEFFTSSKSVPTDLANYVQRLKQHMGNLRVTLPRQHQQRVYIPKQLSDSTHVFIRRDNVQRPLQPAYDGPFKVIRRNDKTITVDKAGKTDVISIDRVKPAFIEADDQPVHTDHSKIVESPKRESQSSTTSTSKSEEKPVTTRYGRRVRWPQRYIATILN